MRFLTHIFSLILVTTVLVPSFALAQQEQQQQSQAATANADVISMFINKIVEGTSGNGELADKVAPWGLLVSIMIFLIALDMVLKISEQGFTTSSTIGVLGPAMITVMVISWCYGRGGYKQAAGYMFPAGGVTLPSGIHHDFGGKSGLLGDIYYVLRYTVEVPVLGSLIDGGSENVDSEYTKSMELITLRQEQLERVIDLAYDPKTKVLNEPCADTIFKTPSIAELSLIKSCTPGDVTDILNGGWIESTIGTFKILNSFSTILHDPATILQWLIFLLSKLVLMLKSLVVYLMAMVFAVVTALSFMLLKLIIPLAVYGKFRGQIINATKMPFSTALYGFLSSLTTFLSVMLLRSVADAIQSMATPEAIKATLIAGSVSSLFGVKLAVCLAIISSVLIQLVVIVKIPSIANDLMNLSFTSLTALSKDAFDAAIGIGTMAASLAGPLAGAAAGAAKSAGSSMVSRAAAPGGTPPGGGGGSPVSNLYNRSGSNFQSGPMPSSQPSGDTDSVSAAQDSGDNRIVNGRIKGLIDSTSGAVSAFANSSAGRVMGKMALQGVKFAAAASVGKAGNVEGEAQAFKSTFLNSIADEKAIASEKRESAKQELARQKQMEELEHDHELMNDPEQKGLHESSSVTKSLYSNMLNDAESITPEQAAKIADAYSKSNAVDKRQLDIAKKKSEALRNALELAKANEVRKARQTHDELMNDKSFKGVEYRIDKDRAEKINMAMAGMSSSGGLDNINSIKDLLSSKSGYVNTLGDVSDDDKAYMTQKLSEIKQNQAQAAAERTRERQSAMREAFADAIESGEIENYKNVGELVEKAKEELKEKLVSANRDDAKFYKELMADYKDGIFKRG